LDNENIWAASGMHRSMNNNIAHFRTVFVWHDTNIECVFTVKCAEL